ncbi:MotA/TolQ/ExbB proton channel family protein [Pseudaestuariivita atlantica]|uniref:MotA/TolQ/ExbB proton channel domain-containing protein n=1 Tax=Pseudaestuariivita atlantica TaxID=1317121 RepID=A0A0L1JSF1_9RHOB|nr:MotA/TolQ/ExbB proton channel family protein [Pseudaestuariivita atlantica]KNG94632.1 hypothetical protein ATO11_04310 [Pseudaestuariivita atlantica]
MAALIGLSAFSLIILIARSVQREGSALDIVSLLATEPLINIVFLPACMFWAYAGLQILGYRVELGLLKGGRVSITACRMLRATGRNIIPAAHSADIDQIIEDGYFRLQTRTDQRLMRPIEFGVGALTMLGLLGTIIGLSLAIQDMPRVLSEDATAQDKGIILGSLGYAFATTIIGILGSLTLSLARMYLSNMADVARALAEDRMAQPNLR